MASTDKTRGNILVVDDIATSRQLLASLLVKNGYDIQTANDGALALNMVHTTIPDLILLDIQMPGMDGYQVCQHLKADERTCDIPVIFISALQDPQDKVKGFAVGSVDYITKPFQAAEVLARVETHMAFRSAQKEIEMQNTQLVQEVADRMQASHALAEREKQYRWLVEHASDIIYRYEYIPQPGFTYVSPAIMALTGYTPEQHYTDPQMSQKLIHPDDRHLWEVMSEGKIASDANITLRWIHKDGRIIWTEHSITPVLGSSGNPVAIQGIARDITTTKQAEKVLRYQALLLENISDAIISTNADFKIQSWNRAAEAIYGWRADEVIGRSFLEVLQAEHSQNQHKIMEQFPTNKYQQGEAVHRHKDGTPIHILGSMTLLKDNEGNVIGGVGANRDITERKQMEEALWQRNRELTTLYEATTAISSDFSLNAVLQTVAGQMTKALNSTGCTLSLWNRERNLIEVLADYALDQPADKIDVPGTTYDLENYPNIRRVLKTRQPIVIQHDDPTISKAGASWIKEQKVQTLLMLPLIVRDQVLGLVKLVDAIKTHNYSPGEIRLAQSIAAHAAIAIENAQLYEAAHHEIAERRRAETKAERRAAQTALIYEVGQRVSGELELEALLLEIVTAVRDAFDYYNASLLLLDKKTQYLTLQSIAGGYANSAQSTDLKIPIGQGMIGYAAATVETQVSGDVSQNPHYVRTADGRTRSELSAPIKSGQKVIGVLDLQSINLHAFDETDVKLMETLTDQIGTAIENARLYETVQLELVERKRAEEGQSRALAAKEKALASALEATRALRESEEKFRSVIEQANDGIVLMDEKGTIIEWNYGQERITGIKREKAMGQSLSNVMLEFERERGRQIVQVSKQVRNSISKFLTTGQASWMNQLQEWEIERTDGKRRFVQTLPFPIKTAKGMLMGIVMRDITEDKQAEQALKKANVDLAARVDELAMFNFITQTVSTMHDLPAILDTIAGTMTDFFDAQRTVIALLGTAQTELVISAHHFSQPLSTSHSKEETQEDNLIDLTLPLTSIPQVVEHREPTIISQSQTDPATRFIRDIMQSRGIHCLMIIPLQARGQVIGIIAVATNQMDREFTSAEKKLAETIAGQVAGAIENARLFDEQQQAKEQALKAKRAAETANRAKSAFLANMSHELRTPLNAILGFTQLLIRDPAITAGQQENLKTIIQSGDHLLSLINDVLEMSKIEAGRTTLSEQDVNLHRLLGNVKEMFNLSASDKGLQLVFDQAPDIPRYVRADEDKLRQVLINLLGNAVKFTQDGCVTLRVRYREAISRLFFSVQDTGPGIASDDVAKLFDPFVQTSRGQESHEGTGLGLPISQRFVHLMGGDLTVTSPPPEETQGSVFTFDMPIKLAEKIDVATPQTMEQPTGQVLGLHPDQQAADGGPYRLLVVEDRKPNRQVLVDLLKSLNYSLPDYATNSKPILEVREAINGQEAVQIWEDWEPHLIWMDMRMPVMDGHEATKQIKATDKGQETIIIALTAGTFEEDRAAILAEGCDDFIGKPFRETDLFDKLSKHLHVRFVYQDEGNRQEKTVDQDQSNNILSHLELVKRLADLSPDWVSGLQQATVLGSLDSILVLIDQIHEQDAALTNTLANLAHSFEHGKIIIAIQQAQEQNKVPTI
ncbi:MAG: PAS domain S-box protein [Chloroflexi bacterium]|nr:PAS domain S-box protein [Chloroflexota bacterium]